MAMPLATRSPGYQFVRSVQISDIDSQGIMVDWASRGVDKWGYDPREAACTWVANNLDSGVNLRRFIPKGYPRQVNKLARYKTGLHYFASVFGAVGAFIAVAAGALTYHFRLKKQIKYAQEFFLYLLSLGFFLVCIGSIIYPLFPSAGTCVAKWWFVVIGFTFALVPLLLKITAINKLMNDAKKMRRTKVSKEIVYKKVAVVVFLVVIYLSVWTGVDPPVPKTELVLSDESSNIVVEEVLCASEYAAWEVIAFVWEASLICSSVAVAVLSRNINQAFNELLTVGNLTYTLFIFLAARCTVFFVPDELVQPSTKIAVTSILLTSESLMGIGIYFCTKFLSIYKRKDDAGNGRSVNTATSTLMFNAGTVRDTCPLCGQGTMPLLPPPQDVTVTEKSETRVCGQGMPLLPPPQDVTVTEKSETRVSSALSDIHEN